MDHSHDLRYSNIKIGIVLPIYKGRDYFERLYNRISRQTIKYHRLLILETESDDEMGDLSIFSNTNYVKVAQKEFSHSGTRNLGAKILTDCDIIIFITQDIMPVNEFWIEELIEPILSYKADLVFSRQLPYPNAGFIEAVSRMVNFPESSYAVDIDNSVSKKIKQIYCSNSSLAVRKQKFDKVNGFPERIIVSEDWALAAKIISSGGIMQYSSQSIIYHSHNFSKERRLKRYFDLGVSMQHPDIRDFRSSILDSLRIAFKYLIAALKTKKLHNIFEVVVDIIIRIIGVSMGKNHKRLPKSLVVKMSEQTYYWKY